MSPLFLILAIVAIVNCKVYVARKNVPMSVSFEEYNKFWNKTHASPAEYEARYLNFLENAKQIDASNKHSKSIGGSARFGFTQFSDMSTREFKNKYLGLIPKHKSPKTDNQKLIEKRSVQQPAGAIDWVAAGKTTAVKNQAQCGSCWAFSATETVESANLISSGSVQNLSPQEIVDCDTSDSGCNGGDPREALGWVQQQGGLDTDACYPYTAQDGTCASSQCTPSATINNVIPVSADEQSIYNQLTTMPLSICCDASQWSNYQGGVLQGSQCGDSVDHAIQLTGYSPSQGGYWIVRNSWGSDWGVNGFIYLQYGANTCDITSEVTGATA
jgi:C1A family cysteine protease